MIKLPGLTCTDSYALLVIAKCVQNVPKAITPGMKLGCLEPNIDPRNMHWTVACLQWELVYTVQKTGICYARPTGFSS